MGTFTVSGGQITGLGSSVTDACVGLVYTGKFKSVKLAYAAARIDREVAVYETASGDLVWRGYVRGGQLGNPSASLIMACADMEHAIPTILVVPRPTGGSEPTDNPQ